MLEKLLPTKNFKFICPFLIFSLSIFPKIVISADAQQNLNGDNSVKKGIETTDNYLCPFFLNLPKSFANQNDAKKARRASDRIKVDGYKLYQQKSYAEAIAKYEEAIKIDPNNADVYNVLGNAFRETERADNAIEAYCKAIKLNPKYELPYNGLGNALSDKEEYGRAIIAYQKAIELDPNYAHAYNNMGVALWYQDKLDDAKEILRKATAIPDQKGIPSSAHAFAHGNLGRILESQDKLKEAIVEYKRTLMFSPRDERIQLFLQEAELELEKQEYPERFNPNPSKCIPNKKEASNDMFRAVVKIISSFSSGGEKSKDQGTGWVLLKPEINKAWIITNRHVVVDELGRKSDEIEIVLYNEPSMSKYCPRYEAKVIYHTNSTSNEPDLALLEVNNLPNDIQPLQIFQGRIAISNPIQIIGNPLNINKWKIVSGKIKNLSNKNTLEVEAPIHNGNSGGPVINAQKQVIGIITSKDTTNDNSGFAHSIDTILEQLRTWGIRL
ncbi:MAG: tetratricopeptide repeat protein [Rivularia sp. (in: cyanobacteria)]